MNLVTIKKLPVMKVGTHIDSQGKPVEITESDLNSMIANLQADTEKNYRPPIVLGHPKMEDPRYGGITGLQKEGSVLFANIGVIPELDAALKKGAYPDRSLRLQKMKDGTFRIKHLGLLGVIPPAVQGLPSYQFKEGDDEECVILEFSENYRMSMIGRIFRRLREAVIAKEGQDAADNIVSNWEIEDLEREIQEPASGQAGQLASEFNEPQEEDMGKIEELETQLATEKAARLKLESAARKKDFAAFCEGEDMKKKITLAMKSDTLDFMEMLSEAGIFEFSEGDDKVKVAPVERFKDYLKRFPDQVEFSEVATKDRAGERKEDEDNPVVAEAKRRAKEQKK